MILACNYFDMSKINTQNLNMSSWQGCKVCDTGDYEIVIWKSKQGELRVTCIKCWERVILFVYNHIDHKHHLPPHYYNNQQHVVSS